MVTCGVTIKEKSNAGKPATYDVTCEENAAKAAATSKSGAQATNTAQAATNGTGAKANGSNAAGTGAKAAQAATQKKALNNAAAAQPLQNQAASSASPPSVAHSANMNAFIKAMEGNIDLIDVSNLRSAWDKLSPEEKTTAKNTNIIPLSLKDTITTWPMSGGRRTRSLRKNRRTHSKRKRTKRSKRTKRTKRKTKHL